MPDNTIIQIEGAQGIDPFVWFVLVVVALLVLMDVIVARRTHRGPSGQKGHKHLESRRSSGMNRSAMVMAVAAITVVALGCQRAGEDSQPVPVKEKAQEQAVERILTLADAVRLGLLVEASASVRGGNRFQGTMEVKAGFYQVPFETQEYISSLAFDFVATVTENEYAALHLKDADSGETVGIYRHGELTMR